VGSVVLVTSSTLVGSDTGLVVASGAGACGAAMTGSGAATVGAAAGAAGVVVAEAPPFCLVELKHFEQQSPVALDPCQ
jgi:hypothetical protein